MEATRRTRVKVCCISSVEEAQLAVASGADALGLVSTMPSGPGVIPDALIAEVAAAAPPGVATFLLTCEEDPERLVAQVRASRVNTVQLVDRPGPGVRRLLRRELPSVKVVQVIHVQDAGALEEAAVASREADALLLDSGNPTAAVKELGGTGRVHDWALSRRIREASRIPVFLAGGLHAGNAAEAVRNVGPYGLDVCSGLRTHGKLDAEKLARFMVTVRSAESEQRTPEGMATGRAPRMWVMISGPYTSGAPGPEERHRNLMEMNRAAHEVFQRGHVPIIGVNMALPVIEAAGPESFERLMMPISLALTERCDAVVRVGGPSRGADDELERFRARGARVYLRLENLPRAE